MSSFVGHSLAALAIHALSRDSRSAPFRWVWLFWLTVLASAPDVDYVSRALSSSAHGGLRITHSVFSSLLLPSATYLALFLAGMRGGRLHSHGIQAVLAGGSHLLLDLLVGVTPLPLFWPLQNTAYALPFGILPSAGQIRLSNYYFYRNLLIELGILVPLFYSLYLGSQRSIGRNRRWKVAGLLGISACFILWSLRLSR
jgi:hypothetical protein